MWRACVKSPGPPRAPLASKAHPHSHRSTGRECNWTCCRSAKATTARYSRASSIPMLDRLRAAACGRITCMYSSGFFTSWRTSRRRGNIRKQGVLVFDELEKSQSHLLIDQAHRYFKDPATGRHRATLIIPEPFFVHSDLTTGVQIADLIAYCISWGLRLTRMRKPAREELRPYVDQILKLRHKAIRQKMGNPQFEIWSVSYIRDLRTTVEKIAEEAEEN